MQTRKRKTNMLQVNSIIYSPNKGRNDSTTNKLMAQIKALLENNRYLEATLARKIAETCKLETKSKTLQANNRHLARTLAKKIAEIYNLENKGLLYENLKLESRVSIKSIQENIMVIETRLQNILSELNSWLSNFSLVRNLTNEAKEKICLFLTLLDNKSDALSTKEFFPDSEKLSSKKKIKLLETVNEDVETPSSVYLKKRKNGTSNRKENFRKKTNIIYNSFKPNSTNHEKNIEVSNSIDRVNDYETSHNELVRSVEKPIKEELLELNEVTDSYELPVSDVKTISRWIAVQNASGKLRQRKPINYYEKPESPNHGVYKTRTHCRKNEKNSVIVTRIDKNETKKKSVRVASESKNSKMLHMSIKNEDISSSELSGKSYEPIAIQNNCSSFGSNSNLDFLHPNTLTNYDKQHNFNKYIPSHFSRIQDDSHFQKSERKCYSQQNCPKISQNVPLNTKADDSSINIKKEVVSPEEDNLEISNFSSETLLSETQNLLEYSAWLRDLG